MPKNISTNLAGQFKDVEKRNAAFKFLFNIMQTSVFNATYNEALDIIDNI